jgi:hypothetical protein
MSEILSLSILRFKGGTGQERGIRACGKAEFECHASDAETTGSEYSDGALRPLRKSSENCPSSGSSARLSDRLVPLPFPSLDRWSAIIPMYSPLHCHPALVGARSLAPKIVRQLRRSDQELLQTPPGPGLSCLRDWQPCCQWKRLQ